MTSPPTLGLPGTELFKLLNDTTLTPLYDLMNRWGVSECSARRSELVDRLLLIHSFELSPQASKVTAEALIDTAIHSCTHTLPQEIDNGEWYVAVTTAPRREPTVETCIKSLRDAGWEPTAFAEPGIENLSCKTIYNNEQKGIWYNWLHSCEVALESSAKYIMTVQDDSLFHPDSRKFAEAALWPSSSAAFLSMYTPMHYTIFPTYRKPVGINKIATRSLWGACALIWDSRMLERVVNHGIAKEWKGAPPARKVGERKADYRKRRMKTYDQREKFPHTICNSDYAIGRIVNELRKEMYFVDPSPVQHIAKYSTVDHASNTGKRNCIRAASHTRSLFQQVPIKYKVPLSL